MFHCNCFCSNYDAEELTLTDTLVNGLRFELIDLLPYPEVKRDYQLDDYTLHLLISD